MALEHGRLRVVYSRPDQKGELLAEAETALP
jgi:hypothetical protein